MKSIETIMKKSQTSRVFYGHIYVFLDKSINVTIKELFNPYCGPSIIPKKHKTIFVYICSWNKRCYNINTSTTIPQGE